MSEKRLQRDLSKKKSIRVSDGDKDFIGEMAQRINACAEVENETENDRKENVDEQESDGSANAFETK